MGRYSPGTSYGHRIEKLWSDGYFITWTVDYYYPSSRLRHPRCFRRCTDTAGARRFAKNWNIKFEDDGQ
jgi:hypothetical protein